jgi:hypothetical protein
MGLELPDAVFEFFMVNWENLGLNPVIVYRLLERGLSHDEIEFAMSTLVGLDWKRAKVTDWLDRLETAGFITIPTVGDTPPVAGLLTEIIRTFNRNVCGYCNLGWLDEKHGISDESYIVPIDVEESMVSKVA